MGLQSRELDEWNIMEYFLCMLHGSTGVTHLSSETTFLPMGCWRTDVLFHSTRSVYTAGGVDDEEVKRVAKRLG